MLALPQREDDLVLALDRDALPIDEGLEGGPDLLLFELRLGCRLLRLLFLRRSALLLEIEQFLCSRGLNEAHQDRAREVSLLELEDHLSAFQGALVAEGEEAASGHGLTLLALALLSFEENTRGAGGIEAHEAADLDAVEGRRSRAPRGGGGGRCSLLINQWIFSGRELRHTL